MLCAASLKDRLRTSVGHFDDAASGTVPCLFQTRMLNTLFACCCRALMLCSRSTLWLKGCQKTLPAQMLAHRSSLQGSCIDKLTERMTL